MSRVCLGRANGATTMLNHCMICHHQMVEHRLGVNYSMRCLACPGNTCRPLAKLLAETAVNPHR